MDLVETKCESPKKQKVLISPDFTQICCCCCIQLGVSVHSDFVAKLLLPELPNVTVTICYQDFVNIIVQESKYAQVPNYTH